MKSKTNKNQKTNEKPCQSHRKRDQWGEKEFGKVFKRDKLPVIRQLNSAAAAAAAAAKSLQSCPTLCDPIDGSPPGSPIPGILQARTLEWVAISFSSA